MANLLFSGARYLGSGIDNFNSGLRDSGIESFVPCGVKKVQL
jgi:hypothetical protein